MSGMFQNMLQTISRLRSGTLFIYLAGVLALVLITLSATSVLKRLSSHNCTTSH